MGCNLRKREKSQTQHGMVKIKVEVEVISGADSLGWASHGLSVCVSLQGDTVKS